MKALPWSITTLDMFLSCPRKYQALKVTKEFKEDFSGPEAEFGDMVHKKIASLVNDNVALPSTLDDKLVAHVKNTLSEIPEDGFRIAEIKGALSVHMDACDFFSRDVWMRCILDVMHLQMTEAWIVDWKTGKVKDDSRQLKLFALYIFHTKTKIEKCHTSFEWITKGKSTKETYHRSDVEDLWQEFIPDLKRFKIAHNEDKWDKKPSGLCKEYCPVTNCEFNGKYKGD